MQTGAGVVIVLLLLVTESLVIADHTQNAWNVPFHDVQHSSLAPVKGPRSGASLKWSKSVPGRTYPIPFTVAGHVGHIFMTDSSGTVLAYNALHKGSAIWTYSMMDEQLAANGTVDMIPVILNSDEKSRQVVVSTCQSLLPHQCVLTVLDENGGVAWSSTQPPTIPPPEEEFSNDSETKFTVGKKDVDPRTHVSEIQWQGRISQVVPALDGDIMLVPLCSVPNMTLKADCLLFGIDPDNGRIVWTQTMDHYIRGDILISRNGIALVPQCDLSTVRPMHACKNIFVTYNVANGERMWRMEWNETVPWNGAGSVTPSQRELHHEIPGLNQTTSIATTSLTYELQLVSRFTGLVADNVFITMADAPNNQVFTIGIEMESGKTRFKKLVEKATTSRLFVACAAAPTVGKPRQVFFMTGGTLFSMDTTGEMVWKNVNISNWVRAMAIDQAGAIYVSSSQLRSGKYVGGLDVYDARGGTYSYSISIPNCADSSASNVTIIPTFAITSERWVLLLCQSHLYGVYSAAVPLWAWITLSAVFAVVLLAVFLIGFVYHRRHNKKFEILE